MQLPEKELENIISANQLPPLPQTLVRLLDECSDAEAELTEVAAIVARDAIISAKILNLANSAFLGTRAQFLNIEQAVIYLGIDTVRNLAISVSVHESFADVPEWKNFSLSEFWYHSLLTALIAKELAEKTGYGDPAEAYLAGLLHDVGKCLFSTVFAEKYDDVLAAPLPEDFLEVEESRLGINHAQAGAQLIQHWKLPEPVSEAVLCHHKPSSLEDEPHICLLVHMANALAGNAPASIQTLVEEYKLQLAAEAAAEILASQKAEVAAVAAALGIAVKQPGNKTTNPQQQKEARKELLSETINFSLLTGVLDNLVKANTTNRIYLVLEESMNILFGIEKTILLLQKEGTQTFIPSGSFRNKIARQLRDTRFSQENAKSLVKNISKRELSAVSGANLTDEDDQTRVLLEIFEEDRLSVTPFPVSSDQIGFLVAAGGTDESRFTGNTQLAMLLLSHIGSRLQLEQLQKQHAMDQVRQQTQALEEISRAIAHEISGPLNIIQNYLALLHKREGFTESLRHELDIIDKEIDRIAGISSQLHDLSKTPTAPKRVKTDIVALIREVIELFQKSLPQSVAVQIRFDEISQVSPLWSVPNSLQQILVNLLTNSLEAVGNTGHINVTVEQLNGSPSGHRNEVVIKVTDSGPGIDPQISDKIFQAGCTTKGGNHSGLGLAIVRKLVNDLGGSIMYQRSEKEKTQFSIYLPVDFRK